MRTISHVRMIFLFRRNWSADFLKTRYLDECAVRTEVGAAAGNAGFDDGCAAARAWLPLADYRIPNPEAVHKLLQKL